VPVVLAFLAVLIAHKLPVAAARTRVHRDVTRP
jgi:hypothetical protein